MAPRLTSSAPVNGERGSYVAHGAARHGAMSRILKIRPRRPQKAIDASQAWFWNPEWQAGEREASAEHEAGRGRRFETSEDFLKSLE